MPFFHYSQNNSGGVFDFNRETGITHHVVIEAADAASADDKLEAIGGYFNGCADGRDCACCGDRWDPAWADDDATPLVYTQSPADYVANRHNWMEPGREVAVHYADGRVEWF